MVVGVQALKTFGTVTFDFDKSIMEFTLLEKTFGQVYIGFLKIQCQRDNLNVYGHPLKKLIFAIWTELKTVRHQQF